MKSILAIVVLTICTLTFAQDKSNPDAQFRELYPKASAGDSGAMFGLGKIYLQGNSSAGKDSAKGLSLIQRSAAVGNVNAMKYLVDFFENSSNATNALEMCQRLQKMGEKYCNSKMESLVERNVPKTTSAASCKKVGDLYESGHQGNFIKGEVMNCVLLGLSNAVALEDAMNNLRTQSVSDPKAFLRILPFLIKTDSPQWDPLYVEEHLTQTSLSFKDREVKELFSKNAITFEGCRKMERLRKETLRQRPAVCRLAAKSGDDEAAIYVGDAYLTGKDYFPEDPSEASVYIREAAASKNPVIAEDAFILLLNLYQKQNKFYEHFAMINQEIKRKTPNTRSALAGFSYEASYFQKNHPSMNLDDIQEIVDLADKNDVPQPLKSQIGKTIDDVIKDRGRLIRPVEKDSLLYYKAKLLSQKDLDDIEAARLAALKPPAPPKVEPSKVADAPPPKKAEPAIERELTFFEKLMK